MNYSSRPTIMATQWPSQQKEVSFLSDELHQCLFLLAGFLLLAFAQSLLQFVMIGLLGLVLIPITLGMIALIGYFSCGAKVNGNVSRFGFSVFVVGLVLLTVITWQVGFFSLNVAFISKGKPPGPGFDGSLFAVAKLIMGGIAAAVAIGSGLGVRSGKRRVGALGLVMALLTLPCTVLFFVVLFWLGSPIST